MTATPPTHADLVTIAARWLSGSQKCTVVVTDMASAAGEIPDAIGWNGSRSTLVECKASRADFLADCDKRWRRYPASGLAGLRYYLAPAGVIEADDLPPHWGLLEPRANGVGIVQCATEQVYNQDGEKLLLLSALRRMTGHQLKGVACRVYHIESECPRATVGIAEEVQP